MENFFEKKWEKIPKNSPVEFFNRLKAIKNQHEPISNGFWEIQIFYK